MRNTAEIKRFYKRQARIYDWTRPVYLPRRREALELLDVRPGDGVIDFACGTGLNLPHLLARNPGWIVGVDYSRPMLERARRRFPSVTFVRGDVTTFRPDRPAERAVCTYGLSLIRDWEKALLNFKRSLAPGARLVILDFHPLRGALAVLDRAYQAWLRRFGLDPTQPLADFLKPRFRHVEEKISGPGYVRIIVAHDPV